MPIQKNLLQLNNTTVRMNQNTQLINMQTPEEKYWSSLPAKEAPDNLCETINSSIDGVGAAITILDNSGKALYYTNKFFLTGMSFQNKERVQILESFDAVDISFFGKNISSYSFAGYAVDWGAQSDDPYIKSSNFHYSSILKLYDTIMRGTKLVEKQYIAALTVANHTILGYPVALQSSYSAEVDKLAQFQMQWVVTKHNLSYPGVISTEEKELLALYDLPTNNKSVFDLDNIISNIETLLNPKTWSTAAALTVNVKPLMALSMIPVSGAPIPVIPKPIPDKATIQKVVQVLGGNRLESLSHADFTSGFSANAKNDLTNFADIFALLSNALTDDLYNYIKKDDNLFSTLLRNVLGVVVDPKTKSIDLNKGLAKQIIQVEKDILDITTDDLKGETAYQSFHNFCTMLLYLHNKLLIIKLRMLY